jgi:hypothetical protein
MRASVTGIGILLLFVLVGVASGASLTIGLAAVGVAAGLTLLVAIGPERLGFAFLLLATLIAPMNRLRVGQGGNVTFADFAFVAGFGLLLPRLLVSSKKLPKLYTIGVTILITNALVVSLLSASPVASLVGFGKVAYAIILLPILLTRLNLDRAMIMRFAWAFVIGQGISLGYALLHPGQVAGGRAVGYTQHPGFFGLSGQMAVCLCIFLFYEVDKRYRWVVVGALGASGLSVFASGARASLLCVVVTLLIWPLVERTAMSMYLMLSAAALVIASANAILANAPEGSALARLQGGGSATGSDLARTLALKEGLRRFWEDPLRGSGFFDILQIHYVYVEVAVGGGIFALAGFLFILAALISPLFRPGVPNRLSYMGVSYAGFALVGPTLYDRVLWAALALAVAGHDFGADKARAALEDEPADDPPVRRPQRR